MYGPERLFEWFGTREGRCAAGEATGDSVAPLRCALGTRNSRGGRHACLSGCFAGGIQPSQAPPGRQRFILYNIILYHIIYYIIQFLQATSDWAPNHWAPNRRAGPRRARHDAGWRRTIMKRWIGDGISVDGTVANSILIITTHMEHAWADHTKLACASLCSVT